MEQPVLLRSRSAEHHTELRHEEYRKAFEFVDKDGDGKLTEVELGLLFDLVGSPMSERALKKLIASVDIDDNGTIDFEEFVTMIQNRKKRTKDLELSQHFSVFDPEGKGYISAERLKRILDEMGEATTMEEAEAMIKFADMSGDGRLSREDFMKKLGIFV